MKQNCWTIKYRSLTYIYLVRSMYVSHWSIIPTMTFIHQIISKILSKITRSWNIGHVDLYLLWGQSLGHTVSLSENMTLMHQIQATPAMSTSHISILLLMLKWYFIPNIFSLCIVAFQLHLYRKRLTWRNRYLEVIFHALDVFSIIYATSYVEVKNQRSHRRHIVCFGYVHVQKSSKQKSKTIKVIYLLSIEQLILYSAQLNPWLFWYAIILSTSKT